MVQELLLFIPLGSGEPSSLPTLPQGNVSSLSAPPILHYARQGVLHRERQRAFMKGGTEVPRYEMGGFKRCFLPWSMSTHKKYYAHFALPLLHFPVFFKQEGYALRIISKAATIGPLHRGIELAVRCQQLRWHRQRVIQVC